MAELVYILCAITSLACCVLLWRGYRRSRARFLLWSSLCFLAMAGNNAMLFVDLVILPQVNLLLARSALALAGMLILLFGLIWDAE